MSCNVEPRTESEHRIRTFIGQGDGAVLTGERRAGVKAHMKSIVRILREHAPEIVVIDTEMTYDEVFSLFKNKMRDGDIIVICSVLRIQGWEALASPFVKGRVTVYCGQELCHQVPVCFKRVLIEE
ncbi:MAG TPA: hypothetical protein VJX93_04480 [Candidatus Methanomethylophilaceae archaeon]|nr:hypothetical protein [Candidatus Methanomethylophilaceae archaeon]